MEWSLWQAIARVHPVYLLDECRLNIRWPPTFNWLVLLVHG